MQPNNYDMKPIVQTMDKAMRELKELLLVPTIQFCGDYIDIYFSFDLGYTLQVSQDEIVLFYLSKEGIGLELIGDEYYFPNNLNIDEIIADKDVIKDYAYAHEKEWELL